jgi:hypothetical protein
VSFAVRNLKDKSLVKAYPWTEKELDQDFFLGANSRHDGGKE